jgi:pimeloyl-ACP methyl ester carboxylesterase
MRKVQTKTVDPTGELLLLWTGLLHERQHEMRTELISIATDTLPLDGAFYLPDAEPSGAAMLFHGNTMNFYVGAPRFLPPVLTSLGLACLAFNRRGHDILSIRDSRAAEGAAFQLTREGIEDNNYAARWLSERGFSRPVVIGHSNGGMLAVKHVSDHPETPALVLLSAHGGGRDGVRRTSRAGMLAGDRLDEITAQARTLVAAGRGRELMLVPGWWYVISAESFLDRMTEMPDVLELAPTIRCPTLFIRGDEEDPETYPAERFKEHTGGPCDVEIVPNCNHFYVGREATICKAVSGWLVRTLNIGAEKTSCLN